MMVIEKYQLRARRAELKRYCPLSKDGDFMELIEWENGEGFDVYIFCKGIGEKHFSLTWGELKLLNILVNS